jgi:hypothetical protein
MSSLGPRAPDVEHAQPSPPCWAAPVLELVASLVVVSSTSPVVTSLLDSPSPSSDSDSASAPELLLSPVPGSKGAPHVAASPPCAAGVHASAHAASVRAGAVGNPPHASLGAHAPSVAKQALRSTPASASIHATYACTSW